MSSLPSTSGLVQAISLSHLFNWSVVALGGFPSASTVKNPPAMQNKRHKFDPQVGKISWRRKWHPTPVFLPGESHGQRSLVGYGPEGWKSQTRLSDQTTTSSTQLLFTVVFLPYRKGGQLHACVYPLFFLGFLPTEHWVEFPVRYMVTSHHCSALCLVVYVCPLSIWWLLNTVLLYAWWSIYAPCPYGDFSPLFCFMLGGLYMPPVYMVTSHHCSALCLVVYICPLSRWWLLVFWFILSGAYMSVPVSQFIPHHPPCPLGVHMYLLYVCVSSSALQIGSSVPRPPLNTSELEFPHRWVSY